MISDSDTINVEYSLYTLAQESGIFSASFGIFNATSCTYLSFIRVANTIGRSHTSTDHLVYSHLPSECSKWYGNNQMLVIMH